MIDLAKLIHDHTLAGKVDFLHKLADHLRQLAADPAGVQDFAGRIKNVAHHLESKLADKIDPAPVVQNPVTSTDNGQAAEVGTAAQSNSGDTPAPRA